MIFAGKLSLQKDSEVFTDWCKRASFERQQVRLEEPEFGV